MSAITLTTTGETPTTVKLTDSGATYGIKNTSTGAVAVAPTGDIAATTPGLYEYDTSALPEGTYQASWEVTRSSGATYTLVVFTIDAAGSAPLGPTLQEIERRLAARVGPYTRPRPFGAGSTASLGLVPTMKSSLSLLEWEDLWLLRRGRFADGSAVVGFDSTDRTRLVAEYDPTLGTLKPDREWAVPPTEGELFELHHLHPEDELRIAVLDGLARCYFWDTVTVTTTSRLAERNITASLPWLVDTRQIRAVEYSYPNQPTLRPVAVGWYKAVRKADGVYLQAQADPYPNSLVITALRPASSYVNGATSVLGPNDDDDQIAVDLAYAVAAAHVEAWRSFPERLISTSRLGYKMSQQMAAREFTKLSLARVSFPPDDIRMGDPGGFEPFGLQVSLPG